MTQGGRHSDTEITALLDSSAYANFAHATKVLANSYPRTPAMTAGISDHVWTCEEIAALLG